MSLHIVMGTKGKKILSMPRYWSCCQHSFYSNWIIYAQKEAVSHILLSPDAILDDMTSPTRKAGMSWSGHAKAVVLLSGDPTRKSATL